MVHGAVWIDVTLATETNTTKLAEAQYSFGRDVFPDFQ